MSRLMDTMENTLMPIAGKISGNRYLNAIRDGFTLALPLIIIGAMFLLVANIPIKGYPEFMAGIFGASWADFFNTVFNATMNLMTIFVIWGIANSLAGYYEVDGLSSAAITFAAFLVITPMSAFDNANYIPFEWMGAKGLFVAILTAILAVEIFRFVVKKGWTIKMPEGVPPSVSRSFSALIPAFIILVVFSLIRLGFAYTSYETVHGFIFTVLQQPLTVVSKGLGASLVANLFISLFWVFGIHGAQIVGAVMSPIWVSLSAQNLAAYDAGAALPNIVTQQFQEIYLQLGGSGCTLA
ncbi:MAG: PTS sugar transporter subunit IIC, partial [Clostridiaceae bacterium]